MPRLYTDRLELFPCPLEVARLATTGKSEIEKLLQVTVPQSWPLPDLGELLPYYARQLEADPGMQDWGVWLIIHRQHRVLIGDAGFKGEPDFTGTVDIGYSLVPEYRGQGYTFEAVQALFRWASAQPRVKRIVAECLTDNFPSIRILEKLEMTCLGQDRSEEGPILKWEYRKGV